VVKDVEPTLFQQLATRGPFESLDLQD